MSWHFSQRRRGGTLGAFPMTRACVAGRAVGTVSRRPTGLDELQGANSWQAASGRRSCIAFRGTREAANRMHAATRQLDGLLADPPAANEKPYQEIHLRPRGGGSQSSSSCVLSGPPLASGLAAGTAVRGVARVRQQAARCSQSGAEWKARCCVGLCRRNAGVQPGFQYAIGRVLVSFDSPAQRPQSRKPTDRSQRGWGSRYGVRGEYGYRTPRDPSTSVVASG